jgi:3-isopropylmalate dehydrogenase
MARRRIILLPGDGIGPEVIGPAVQVLDAVAPAAFEFDEHVFGGG